MAEIKDAYRLINYTEYIHKQMSNEIGESLFKMGFDTNYIRNYLKKKGRPFMHNCEVCGKPDNEKPMAFRTMPWCCENHRKKVQGDVKIERH